MASCPVVKEGMKVGGGGESIAILGIHAQCAKHTQSMQSMTNVEQGKVYCYILHSRLCPNSISFNIAVWEVL